MILDEYHYGAWRDKAKELFEGEDSREVKLQEGEGINFFKEENMPITTNFYLYLSGTPFRAISTGEFIEEQIFNWTYTDEQNAKKNWLGEDNPYSSLPRMILMTYKVPDYISHIANEGEFDEFDLNTFLLNKNDETEFIFKDEVPWLDLIRGQNLESIKDNLKLKNKAPYPWR